LSAGANLGTLALPPAHGFGVAGGKLLLHRRDTKGSAAMILSRHIVIGGSPWHWTWTERKNMVAGAPEYPTGIV